MKTTYYLIIFFSLAFGSCREDPIKKLESTQPEVGECRYQDFEKHCKMSYDSSALNWRFSGFGCDYFNLTPQHVDIEQQENVDWVLLEKVPFWMTVNWELRVKQEVKRTDCFSSETGELVTCFSQEFPKEADKKGCQTICPETPLIIIPLGGLESNLEKVQYEVIIHAFCGRIVLYGGTVEK